MTKDPKSKNHKTESTVLNLTHLVKSTYYISMPDIYFYICLLHHLSADLSGYTGHINLDLCFSIYSILWSKIFGHIVFIYSVVHFWSNGPVSPKKKTGKNWLLFDKIKMQKAAKNSLSF